MNSSILPDTCFCAIIRDERSNPAGGVARFLSTVLPHVSEAVIVDTGSIDGTREILARARATYPQLRVYDVPFEGYAHARNTTLEYATKPYVLMLDADELIPSLQYDYFDRAIQRHDTTALFLFEQQIEVYPNGARANIRSCAPRLFQRAGARYHARSRFGDEFLLHEHFLNQRIVPQTTLLHFLPSLEGIQNKQRYWYHSPALRAGSAPSLVPLVETWKSFNPERDHYH